jgi:hypothetical protein
MPEANCFISYSWDSADHKNWVLRLAEELHKNGVYVYLDQWDVRPGSDIPQYMESSIRGSNFVLLICTPNFAEKANSGLGGVGYEKSIVTGEIFQLALPTTKFIPVLKSGSPATSIPSYLRSKAFVDFKDDEAFQLGIEQLLRHIHGIPAVARPALGNPPNFSRVDNDSINPVSKDTSTRETLKSKRATSNRFNTDLFATLRNFAYSGEGLDLTSDGAKEWALNHLNDTPPFDTERFCELRKFAYSEEGLDLTDDGAKEWALDHLNDTSPFQHQTIP